MPRHFPPVADPTAIGRISAPPFAILPEPETLFAVRAERLRFLAGTSELGGYLLFLAGIADAQDMAARSGLPEPAALPPERLALATEHGMPPIDRAGLRRDAVLDRTLRAVFDAAADLPMPVPAAEALARVRGGSADAVDGAIADVLADSAPVERVAEHVFVAAALQVHAARLASRLPAADLKPIGETLCPACGGPPAVSLVVGWPGAENIRFCACPLCATAWHYVRVRCTACGSTKGIGYQAVEGGAGTVKAETCESCGSYGKVCYQSHDPAMEPIADDVASLGLDLLMRDGPYRRSGYNPFLIGY